MAELKGVVSVIDLVGSIGSAGSISGRIGFDAGLTGDISMGAGEIVEEYDGPTSIVPSDREQVLETKNLKMKENIVIEQIPSNYGKIEWDGSRLRIS